MNGNTYTSPYEVYYFNSFYVGHTQMLVGPVEKRLIKYRFHVETVEKRVAFCLF